MTTLASTFPVKEVATAAAVSTSTTAMVVAIVCCCCFPCRKKRGRKKNLDVNENEKGKEEEEGRGDRLFHQRYEGDGCGRSIFEFCIKKSMNNSEKALDDLDHHRHLHSKLLS